MPMIEEIIEVPVEETTMRCTCIWPDDGCTSCPVGTNSLEKISGYTNWSGVGEVASE